MRRGVTSPDRAAVAAVPPAVVDSVVLPYWFDRPAAEAMAIALAAENAGVPGLWVGEMATFDAFALAGAIAAQTQRIELWVGPLALGVRSPVGMALGISSVSQLGERPARLALGASSPAIVTGWHGRAFSNLPQRLGEVIAALRPLLRGERAEFEGQLVKTHGFRLRTALPSPDITVAAFGPQMVKTAARRADRLLLNLLAPPQVTELRQRFLAARPSGDGLVAGWVPVALEPDERALGQLAAQVAVYLRPPGYGEMFTKLGFGELVEAARGGVGLRELAGRVPLELLEAVCVLGDEASVRRGVARYRDAGLDHFAAVPVTAHDPGGARLMEVLAGHAA